MKDGGAAFMSVVTWDGYCRVPSEGFFEVGFCREGWMFGFREVSVRIRILQALLVSSFM